jgi:rhodanese-related sulfurtransferase
MSDPESIKRLAAERATQIGLPYSGAVTPKEAYVLMQAGAVIVDVRTKAEVYWVGRVQGSVFVEWNGYPEVVRNPLFLEQLAESVAKDTPIVFLCRSGNRSHFAAIVATEAGWGECYNILEGFEGDRDAKEHRSSINGWRVAGLPWVQG